MGDVEMGDVLYEGVEEDTNGSGGGTDAGDHMTVCQLYQTSCHHTYISHQNTNKNKYYMHCSFSR